MARRLELKSRLSAIQVPASSPVSSALQSTTAKLLYGAIVAAGIGWAIYSLTTDDHVEATGPVIDETTIYAAPPLSPEEIIIPEVETAETATPIARAPVATAAVVEETPETVSTPLTTIEDEGATSFTPQISMPSVDMENDDDMRTPDDDVASPSNPNLGNTSMIDVQVFPGGNGLSFKYFDNKLSLFGDFSESPYEVLEVNSQGTREIYLFHDDRYFTIILTRVTIPLRELSDQKKIQELSVLRSNK